MADPTSNPILTELQNLSPGAQQTLAQMHQSALNAKETATPPPPPNLSGMPAASMPSLQAPASPSVGMAPPPTIAPPARGTLAGDQAERSRLLSTGSGISQIHSKIEDAMPNHPILGKVLGWGAQIPAQIGEAAGSMFAPIRTAESLLPGTTAHHAMELRNLNTTIGKESEEGLKGAQTSEANALTAKDQAEAANAPQTEKDKHDLATATIGNLNSEAQERGKPKPPTNEFELWHQQNPNSTVEDYNKIQKAPISQADADSRNAVWDSIADKYHLPKGQFKAGMSGADAAQLAAAMNQVVGRDQGGTKITIQQQAANNAGQRTRDNETNKEFLLAQNDLSKQFQTAYDQHDALQTARQEINNGAMGQAFGTIKSLVGLAGGKGSGVRITQSELNSIAHARGIAGDFDGWINSISGKGKLSDDQVKQLNTILGDVDAKIQEKLQNQSKYLDQLSNAGSAKDVRDIRSQYRHELLGESSQGNAAPPQRPAGVPSNAVWDQTRNNGKGSWRMP